MKTPRQTSPFGPLMQELFRDEPWKLLVCCILLNRTTRTAAEPVWDKLFEKWLTPEALARDYSETFHQSEEGRPFAALSSLLRPLGFQNRRAERIGKMTDDYLGMRDEIMREDFDVRLLHGIGKYGADSFDMFVRGEMVWDVEDKELRRYVEWVRNSASGSSEAGDGIPKLTG